jgi:O-antigen ligase
MERLSICCLVVLLAVLPFWRHRVLRRRIPEAVFFEFHDFVLYTNDLLWGMALGSWFLSRRLNRDPNHWQLEPRCLSGLSYGLVLLSFISVPFADGPTYASYQALRLFLLLVLYLMVLNAAITPALVAWAVAAGTTLQASVALPQFTLGHTLGLKRLGEVVIRADWPGASVVMVGDGRWLRAYGLTQHPNLLGGCLMAFLLLIAGYYLDQQGGQRVLLLTVLGLGLTTLLATFSRSAWLGAVTGGLVMLALLGLPSPRHEQPLSRRSIGLLLAVALGVVTLFTTVNWPLVETRLGLVRQGVEIRSVEERSSLTAGALALIRRRPVTGVGLGNFATALYWFASETVADYPVYQPVHNVFLLATAELGILGGVLWLGLTLAPWIVLWRGRRRVRMTPWLAGLSGALAALTVVSWLDAYVWSSHQGRMLQWLMWGLWARAWNDTGKEIPQ